MVAAARIINSWILTLEGMLKDLCGCKWVKSVLELMMCFVC